MWVVIALLLIELLESSLHMNRPNLIEPCHISWGKDCGFITQGVA